MRIRGLVWAGAVVVGMACAAGRGDIILDNVDSNNPSADPAGPVGGPASGSKLKLAAPAEMAGMLELARKHDEYLRAMARWTWKPRLVLPTSKAEDAKLWSAEGGKIEMLADGGMKVVTEGKKACWVTYIGKERGAGEFKGPVGVAFFRAKASTSWWRTPVGRGSGGLETVLFPPPFRARESLAAAEEFVKTTRPVSIDSVSDNEPEPAGGVGTGPGCIEDRLTSCKVLSAALSGCIGYRSASCKAQVPNLKPRVASSVALSFATTDVASALVLLLPARRGATRLIPTASNTTNPAATAAGTAHSRAQGANRNSLGVTVLNCASNCSRRAWLSLRDSGGGSVCAAGLAAVSRTRLIVSLSRA